jgi:hypothetical protein
MWEQALIKVIEPQRPVHRMNTLMILLYQSCFIASYKTASPSLDQQAQARVTTLLNVKGVG